ncbi:hypothetical protein B0T25DRAFT_138501 [Lasiosphaeria hispida]|uniref:NACHT domain-containing protein n=1 Tax=Lasiosphaeria hispida TaxID=260671 RepID=A0AAJ0HLF9_9PEZI|nr:hypothetical protein B0T25DRAFT_138501 [Lasiosphaeria hispida]
MSGLEPLAALGLVCNVFQVVSFAEEVCKASKSVFETGAATNSVSSLAATLDSLKQAFDDIQKTAELAPQPMTRQENEILKIAKDCTKAALALKTRVEKTQNASGAKGNLIRSAIAGVKAAVGVGSKEVERLAKMVEVHRNALETRILADICSRTDAITISQQDGFENLNVTLRGFIRAYSAGESRASALLRQESDSIKKHITTKASELGTTLNQLSLGNECAHHEISQAMVEVKNSITTLGLRATDNTRHERLLKSLKYATMKERHNQIVDPHPQTFEWIYRKFPPPKQKRDDSDQEYHDTDDEYGEGGDNDNESWSNSESDMPQSVGKHAHKVHDAASGFIQWAQAPTSRLFWISGKPGSGKSTLMKFLASDRRTQENLDYSLTNSKSRTTILSHFLWSAGQPMEAKIKGLLCSLLYQIISNTDVSRIILTQYPNTDAKDFDSDWSEKELRDVLFFLLPRSPRPLCLFLDGLDEIHPSDGQLRLLELMDELQSIPCLKMCVASRPEPLLQMHLIPFPMFRIQDLTFGDIKRFATGGLKKTFQNRHLNIKEKQYEELVSNLCEMAEGVFLWVVLALRNLQSGLIKGDDSEDLVRRLKALPNDLVDLYKVMWDRLGDDKEIYRKDAARYLNLVLTEQSIDYGTGPQHGVHLFTMLLAINKGLVEDVLAQGERECHLLSDYTPLLKDLGRRVDVRCAGLLEIIGLQKKPMDATVRFVHRSAVEFFQANTEGKLLLSFDNSTRENRVFDLTMAHLATSTYFLLSVEMRCDDSDLETGIVQSGTELSV